MASEHQIRQESCSPEIKESSRVSKQRFQPAQEPVCHKINRHKIYSNTLCSERRQRAEKFQKPRDFCGCFEAKWEDLQIYEIWEKGPEEALETRIWARGQSRRHASRVKIKMERRSEGKITRKSAEASEDG